MNSTDVDVQPHMDCEANPEDGELSSQSSTSDTSPNEEDAEVGANSTADSDDRALSPQGSTSDLDRTEMNAEDDAQRMPDLDDSEVSSQSSSDGTGHAGETGSEPSTDEAVDREGDIAEDDADRNEADDKASVVVDDNSEDDRTFSTPLQAPNESFQMFLMDVEPLDNREARPINEPLDQQETDIVDEMQHLPVIEETEVLSNAPAARQAPLPLVTLNARRLSDPHLRGRKGSPVMGTRRRASSMTDFQRLHRLNLYPLKASPAECAVTACTVRAAEQPKINTVYQHPAARYRQDSYDERATQTIQTVCSGSSTYQMLWEEPSRSSSDSDMTLFEEANAPGVQESEVEQPDNSLLAHVSRTPSPMRKARTKLAAWSWAKEQEQDDDSDARSTPLAAMDESVLSSPRFEIEEPPAPPNTGKTSSASSVRHSGPHSPYEEDDASEVELLNDIIVGGERDPDDNDTDSPVELRFRSTLSRVKSMPASTDYLNVPGSSRSPPTSPSGARYARQLSNLAAEEEHFKGHRDSVDLYHRREREEELNKQLMTTRDSFVLAKTKYDTKHPKFGGGGQAIQYSRFGGLSPIMDASPPESRIQLSLPSKSKLAKDAKTVQVEEAHPEEHVGCAIYEVERPRWFEANCKTAMA